MAVLLISQGFLRHGLQEVEYQNLWEISTINFWKFFHANEHSIFASQYKQPWNVFITKISLKYHNKPHALLQLVLHIFSAKINVKMFSKPKICFYCLRWTGNTIKVNYRYIPFTKLNWIICWEFYCKLNHR